MAFEHAPLTESELGPAVWRVVNPDAPAPLQGMVARGLAPLGPRDLLLALYQFWVLDAPELAELSAKTLGELPSHLVGAALADPSLWPGVLDFVARKVPRSVEILEAVVRHPRVDDQTLISVARICPDSICDLLADNQARWLGCPAIVESLYQNPHCRMSVAQRMLELAVREGLDLKLPNIEEIRHEIFAGAQAEPDDDSADDEFRRLAQPLIDGHDHAVERLVQAGVAQSMALDQLEEILESAPTDDLSLPLETEDPGEDAPVVSGDPRMRISKLRPMKKIRLALLGNAFERAILIRDSNRAVSMSAIKSPKVKEREVAAFAASPTLSPEVIRYIASRRDWIRQYSIKLNLVLNPKTPMASALSLLTHLYPGDVKKVARSRNIPHALATAAKRRMERRR